MRPLPSAFRERMQGLLGADYPAFAACYDQPAHTGLRVNTLKITPQNFSGISSFTLGPVPWCPSGFRVMEKDETRPGKHPHHAAGLYYLQEPSAMIVAEVAAPQPGQRVLDLAASPGGKSTHLACLLAGDGLLWANEIRTKRIPQLVSNLERWGVCNAVVSNETPERLADHLPGFFDVVVVDAPCSGEGMFRKEPDVSLEWNAAQIPAYSERQRMILRFAARLVRPGGVLVYSTCTFNPDENEKVIASFLDEQDHFRADELNLPPGFSRAMDTTTEGSDSVLACSARLWPHLSLGEGHFVARLRCVDGEGSLFKPFCPASLPRLASRLLYDFSSHALTPAADVRLPILNSLFQNLAVFGDHVYALPAGLPDVHGLRISQPGWHIGYLRKERFEPSHALALALRVSDFARTLELSAADARLAAYLRGETLSSAGLDGWLVICVDGFPLGWGKRVKGVIKNHYPSGLRWV